MRLLSNILADRQLLLVYSSLFIVSLGLGVMLPLLPFYTERLALGDGISEASITFHIGFLTSTYPFFQMILAPIWGKCSDLLGRKPLIFIGLSGFVLMQLLAGISTSLAMLYFSRVIGGVFTSAIIPVCYAYISDLTTKQNRFRGIAFAGVSSSLGVVLGPSLGGLLSKITIHFDWQIGHFLINDYSTPFFFLALLGILVLFVTMSGLKKVKQSTIQSRESQKHLVGWKSVARLLFPLLVLSFFYQIGITLFESVFSIYAKNILRYDAIMIGVAFMICASMMGLLQPLVASPKFNKLLSHQKQVIGGFGLFAFGILLIPVSENTVWVLVMVGLLATGGAFIIPNLTAFISFKSEQKTGTALGVQNSVNSLGQVLGPIIGSGLFTLNGSLPFLTTGGAIIVLTFLLPRNKRFRSAWISHSVTISDETEGNR